MDKKEIQKRNEAYNRYVKARLPKTKAWPSLFNSFWVGGVICCIGQGINDLILLWFPSIAEQSAWALTLITLILIASFLTGIGVYDKIGKFAGGGSIVPITGFSNSITSPALEFKHEGVIYGICVKMFTIAGPVIVSGVVASVVVGIIYLFI
ncbi:MAG: SpoVA/SpoVAEb family sporulation membrane protein [Clostridia bacterium]|jgi:stage V sporulation protein AC|nr:SpoVA/SpoVAEb family sporulation membrane protein [Clostridia bacterium]